MSVNELLVEIERLSLDERLLLLEALSRNIRASLHKTPAERVRGVLSSTESAPTDEEVERMYTDYLEVKYR